MAIMAVAASAPEFIGRIDLDNADEGQESRGRMFLDDGGDGDHEGSVPEWPLSDDDRYAQ